MNIENMIQGNPQALVKSVNGIMVADSLQVADSFGKQHSHVLRAIESLITSLSTEEAAVNDEEWMYKKIAGNSQSNFGLAGNYFIPDTYADKQGKERKHYWLTRDGFSLLVMGFTGPAALHWKLLYIEAFNKMEQALRSNVDIRQLVTQITTDVLRTVLPDIRQAVEPPPEIEDGRVHNSRRLDFLYGNDEALPNFLTVYDISDDATMECINIIHQGGSGALTRILAKTQKPYTAKTIYAALCTDPADKSNNNQVGDYVTRQKVVYGFITKYCNKEGVNTMGYSRQAVADLVNSWVGKNEADGSYKTIIDIYNGYKGAFPRGTKMEYSWAWCACTWSAAAIKLGYTPIMPIEISCYYLIEAAKKKGIWIENDAHVPKVGEGVLYYWKDGTNFATTDCTGVPDHVGTVTEVYEKAGYFVVTEGNYSNAVKKRTMLINGRYIRGFISPKYTDDTVTPVTPAAGKDLTTVAREVILGVWGNMPERKTKLEASGYNFTDVQNKVNELLNKNVPTPSKPQNTGVTKVVAGSGAASFDKSLAGSYVTTTGLYMRHGAGKNKRAMVLIPEGTKVQNYGYYTSYNGTKWLYIQVTLNGVQYTGFSCKTYLKKQ